MRQLDAKFFELKNFVKDVVTYDYIDVANGKETMHCTYNVDDSFFYIMGASIVSVLKYNPDKNMCFYVFTDYCTDDNLDKIKTLAQQWHCKCVVYFLNIEPFEHFHIKTARFKYITYARIYMPKVLKAQTDRYIYIDADAMCIHSLDSLWHYDLGGKAFGAAEDAPETAEYRISYIKLKNHKYFNDGIMLVDVNEWEKQRVTERAFELQDEPKERFLGHDQDIMNLTMDGDVCFLPRIYNILGHHEDYFDRDDAVIIHWAGRRKPWQMVCMSYDKEWRKCNTASPWPTITNILPIKKSRNYHDFKHWGKYYKEHQKDRVKYLQGMFWYCVLRVLYKLGF